MPALFAFESCASTSDVARRLAQNGAAHGTTVVADHQSAGRGRQGRPWLDRPGASLLLSMVLRPAAHAHDASALPLLVGLACARALRATTPLDVRIEWPNDLVVRDRKLGGILCEASHARGVLDFVIAGIGINVAALPADLDPETRTRATSMTDALGAGTGGADAAPPDRATLAREIARRVAALRADARIEPADLAELRSLDSLLDRPVRLGTGPEGVARGIVPDGALLVDTEDGRLTVRSGSVSPAAPGT